MASRAERALSFGAVAEDYDRLRPTPPRSAIDWLLPDPCLVAVDLGAGTGLLSRALAIRAGQVVAVEPDERMRSVLQARSPGVTAVAGRGEAIPLPEASADGVFVSSAWHWMDPDLTVPEVARVLRDGGRLGVIWTTHDRETGWLREVSGREDPRQASPPEARPRPHEVRLPDGAPLEAVATESFRFSRLMRLDAIVDMLATYSDIITASPRDREAALARARATLQRQFPDATQIDVPMRSWCWRADRVARAGPGR